MYYYVIAKNEFYFSLSSLTTAINLAYLFRSYDDADHKLPDSDGWEIRRVLVEVREV